MKNFISEKWFGLRVARQALLGAVVVVALSSQMRAQDAVQWVNPYIGTGEGKIGPTKNGRAEATTPSSGANAPPSPRWGEEKTQATIHPILLNRRSDKLDPIVRTELGQRLLLLEGRWGLLG